MHTGNKKYKTTGSSVLLTFRFIPLLKTHIIRYLQEGVLTSSGIPSRNKCKGMHASSVSNPQVVKVSDSRLLYSLSAPTWFHMLHFIAFQCNCVFFNQCPFQIVILVGLHVLIFRRLEWIYCINSRII